MKKLSDNYIRMAKELEKSKDTFKPKCVWVRAWQIMRDNHYAVYGTLGSDLLN